MIHRPKILGRVQIGVTQAATLADGGALTLTKSQFRAHTAARGRVGDLLWVQEPVLVITTAETVQAYRRPLLSIPAPFPSLAEATRQVRSLGFLRAIKTRRMEAGSMRRINSRCTLEITGFDAHACTISCIAHMQQVDDFVKARAA